MVNATAMRAQTPGPGVTCTGFRRISGAKNLLLSHHLGRRYRIDKRNFARLRKRLRKGRSLGVSGRATGNGSTAGRFSRGYTGQSLGLGSEAL